MRRSANCGTFGPLTRTIAIAPLPGGVAIAAIVSIFTGAPSSVSTGKNDDSAFGLFAFRFRAHQLGSRQSEMDDLSLRRKHRFELLRLLFAHAAFERCEREILELIGAVGAIALGVDGIVVTIRTHAGIENVVEEEVQRFKRVAVTPNQGAQMLAIYFEILAFGTANITNLDGSDAHLSENFPKQISCGSGALGNLTAFAGFGAPAPRLSSPLPSAASSSGLTPGWASPNRSIANVGGLFFELKIVFVEHRRNLYLI